MLVELLGSGGVHVEAFHGRRDLFEAQEVLFLAAGDKLLDFLDCDDLLERHLLTSDP